VPVYEGANSLDRQTKAAWRRSAFPGGSPGDMDVASIPDMALDVTATKEAVQLRFQGALGRVYSVWEFNPETPELGWQKVGTVFARANAGILEWLNPSTEAAKLYRVSTP